MTRTHVVGSILLGALAGSLTGCTDEGTQEARFELTRLGSCDDVRERIRAQTIADMEARLEAARQEALATDCSYPITLGGAEDDNYSPPAPGSSSGGGGGGGAPTETSGTNNQVAGVDEADLVKSDGGYLYIANAGKLRIIDAWPAAQTHAVSEVAIEGEVKKLLLHDGRAVVYSSPGASSPFDRECTYGYGCDFLGDGRPTKLTVVDVRDPAAPRVVREIRLSGSLIAARRVGSGVHTVVTDHAHPIADLTYWPEGLDYCSNGLMKTYAFEELRRRNREIIARSEVDLFLPTAADSVAGELGGRCDQFYGADVGDGAALTSVLSLDLPDPDAPVDPAEPAAAVDPAARGRASFTSIVSQPGAVYGAEDALYMAVRRVPAPGGAEASAIHKFSITPSPLGTEYRGTARVPGHVLNQFSMDQYGGVLRVATTTGHAPDPDAHSTVTTLREAPGGGLEVVGAVDGLAPSEDIRSVRFAGPRGFLVTFKKTDPLYVLDLDPPQAPRVLGELHIPGFSTYMHMLDDTHLLSIGYDASDQGAFAWFSGVQLQIFDLTDPTAPALTHRHVIGTRGSSSEALTNHLAFTYFASRQALALPMTICESASPPPAYGEMTFSGLLVLHAAAADGFAELGRVTHPPGDGVTCSNWWSDAASQVRRSVFMDDYVYSISGTALKVNALADLATDLVTVPIAN